MPKVKTHEKQETAQSSKAELLTSLLKTRTPGIFEKEPTPAFAEGNLARLVTDILTLLP